MAESNITVLNEQWYAAHHGRACDRGVEIAHNGLATAIGAVLEVVLSFGGHKYTQGAVQSGIGDELSYSAWGFAVCQHLPGVGRNFRIIL